MSKPKRSVDLCFRYLRGDVVFSYTIDLEPGGWSAGWKVYRDRYRTDDGEVWLNLAFGWFRFTYERTPWPQVDSTEID